MNAVDKIKALAAEAGMSVSEYLLDEDRHNVQKLTPEELRSRLSARQPVHLVESDVDIIREDRNHD